MIRVEQHFFRHTATVLLVCLFADETRAQCTRYTVKVPHPLGICGILGETNTPSNISPQGDLVGEWSCAGGNERAFVAWDAQQIVLLPLPNTEVSTAEGMNSHGAIVGTRAVSDLGYRGFIYQNGQLTDLSWLPGHNWAEAYDVNDSLIAVGFSGQAEQIACRWVGSSIELLELPVGPSSVANSINQSNQIVGWMGVYPATHFFAQAFLWDKGEVVELPMPAAATNSTANAISDDGLICGYYSIADPQGAGGYKRRALAWFNGEMIDLGTLPGLLASLALDVNDSGNVVGYCLNPPQLGNDHAGFIWRDGVMKKLDDLIIPNPSQYRVARAVGVNDNGQIAADMYGVVDAARLDPVPPRPGDTNCDWLVNVIDLLAVINAWGPAPPPVPFEGSPDLNSDGTVNVLDLLAIINDWG